MSSIQTAGLFMNGAYKQCFKVLVPDMQKWDGQYTEHH